MDEVVAPIVAMVGTSALLFFAMAPKDDKQVQEFIDPTKLKGCFRYSHYHRKKFDISMSSVSCVSDCSSIASARSDVTSDSDSFFEDSRD